VAASSTCIQHMQKTLTQMNVQLANVISDISGVAGMANLRAIVAGERDPERLAALKHNRVRASREEIARSLEGNWREELLFVLEQSLDLYDLYIRKITICDQRIECHLKTMAPKRESGPQSGPAALSAPKHQPHFSLKGQLCRIAGVDLTKVAGLQVQTVQTIISEVGVDMSRWHTEKQFASWLGLCPDNRISGGKVLKSGTDKLSIVLLPLCASLHGASSEAKAHWVRTSADYDPSSVPPKRSPQWPISWPDSFTE
jgi:transposase